MSIKNLGQIYSGPFAGAAVSASSPLPHSSAKVHIFLKVHIFVNKFEYKFICSNLFNC